MRVCSVEGCGNPQYGRGLCAKHYQRAERMGVLSQYPPLSPNDPGPSIIPVGWMPAAGPQPYSRELITQRSNAVVIDAARDARDAERFDVRLTPAGLVVRERAEVAA